MKVKLIDIDSKIPNLALMKISTHHKKLGDRVGFSISNPDIIYASVIFTKNKYLTNGLRFFYPDTRIILGGCGYDARTKIPFEPDNGEIKPDYSLYPEIDYSLGFTTRGCVRNCPFCIVKQAEGSFRISQHPKEFHDDKFDKIKLLDNNILANKRWFFEITDWILQNDLRVEFNQGLDIRLLDQEIANRLGELKIFKTIKFAWDQMESEESVRNGIEMLKKADLRLRDDIFFYVLVNFDTSHKEDVYRCRKLKEWGTNPFVMEYDGGDRFTKHLARWANRKWFFWSHDISEYDRLPEVYRKEFSEQQFLKLEDFS